MSTITLRATKGSPLTNTEVDNNFSNLNTDKLESGYAGAMNSLTGGSSIVTVSSSTGITTGAWKATTISPLYGGTGVAQASASSTLTISGAYGTTFTVGATTSLTLPASGTLATLAGSESLTNKKLGSLTTNGLVTTSGSDGSLSVTTTLGVATGGTGASSQTAYAVLCGGTTSTGAFQSIASVGSSGNVLTSNGASALPTFQALPATGVTVSNDTTSNANTYYPLLSNNTITGTLTAATTSTTKLYFNPSTGTLNATNFNSLSDETLKSNVVPIVNATAVVRLLQGVEFDWTDTGDKSSGVIAQQLEGVLPHLVNTNEDGIKSVNYQGITAYLIEAFKEFDQRLQKLEE
jgi:hypothetical protein